MNAEQRQTAADRWTKPTDLSHWPAYLLTYYFVTCAGLRQPEIRWSKVDGVLPVDHVAHDGTLIINQVSAEDAGVYECIAVGAYRTTRSRMELFILGSFFYVFL